MLKHVKENRFKPMHVDKSSYNKFATLKLSSKTIHRYLHKNGPQNYVATVKPFLSPNSIRTRKQRGAEAYKTDWNNGRKLFPVMIRHSLYRLLHQSTEFGGILEPYFISIIHCLLSNLVTHRYLCGLNSLPRGGHRSFALLDL